MLHPITVSTITKLLSQVEALAETTVGWNATPTILGVLTRDGAAEDQVFVQPLPIANENWEIPDPSNPGQDVPVTVVLGAIAEHMAGPAAPDWFASWARPDGYTTVAVAFVGEYWASEKIEGYVYGDLRAMPALASKELRVVTGYDMDGRLHEIKRVRGSRPDSIVVPEPTSDHLGSLVGTALRDLLAACGQH